MALRDRGISLITALRFRGSSTQKASLVSIHVVKKRDKQNRLHQQRAAVRQFLCDGQHDQRNFAMRHREIPLTKHRNLMGMMCVQGYEAVQEQYTIASFYGGTIPS